MAYKRVVGIKRRFSIVTSKKDFTTGSGNVFAGDLKIKGKITIEGVSRAMVIDEGSFRTKAIE